MPVVTRQRSDTRTRRPFQWDLFEAQMRERELTSVAAIARELGTDPGTLFRIRRLEIRPGLDLALTMAEKAQVSVEALFTPPAAPRQRKSPTS